MELEPNGSQSVARRVAGGRRAMPNVTHCACGARQVRDRLWESGGGVGGEGFGALP